MAYATVSDVEEVLGLTVTTEESKALGFFLENYSLWAESELEHFGVHKEYDTKTLATLKFETTLWASQWFFTIGVNMRTNYSTVSKGDASASNSFSSASVEDYFKFSKVGLRRFGVVSKIGLMKFDIDWSSK